MMFVILGFIVAFKTALT